MPLENGLTLKIFRIFIIQLFDNCVNFVFKEFMQAIFKPFDHTLDRMAKFCNLVRFFRAQILFNILEVLLHSYKLNEKVPIGCDLTDTYFINEKNNIFNNFKLLKSFDQVIVIL